MTPGFVFEGRRVIDLSLMSKQMQCVACNGCLHLKDIVHEIRYGLASMFGAVCPNQQCRHMNKITTSERHVNNNGPFTVNSKSVLGK